MTRILRLRSAQVTRMLADFIFMNDICFWNAKEKTLRLCVFAFTKNKKISDYLLNLCHLCAKKSLPLQQQNIRIYGAGYWRKGIKLYEKENSVH